MVSLVDFMVQFQLGWRGRPYFEHHVPAKSLSPPTLSARAMTARIPPLVEADQGSNTWHLCIIPTLRPDAGQVSSRAQTLLCATTQPEATYSPAR